MVQTADASPFDANDPRRGGGVARTTGQTGSVAGADDANRERAQDVKEAQSQDERICGFGEVAAWRFHLSAREHD